MEERELTLSTTSGMRGGVWANLPPVHIPTANLLSLQFVSQIFVTQLLCTPSRVVHKCSCD